MPSAPPGGPTAPTCKERALRPWSDHLSGTRPGRVSDPTGPRTLLEAWSNRWAVDPGALLWKEAGRWCSAGEFDAATRRAAGRLQAAGLVPGDRVVWSTGTSVARRSPMWVPGAGLVVVPANTAYSERELAQIVADVRPAAAVVERGEQAAWVRGAAATPLVVTGPALDLPDAEPRFVDRAAPDDPALICFTSGTTGAPKGAVLRHRNLLAATEALRVAWRWSPDDRLVHCLPLFHAHGLAVGAYGTLLAGGSAVLLPGFDPGAVADAARDDRATLFFGVPTMYHRLVASGRAGGLRGLRLCVSGSAPLSAELHADASRAVGSVLLERYGMTETLMNASNPYDGERRAGHGRVPPPRGRDRLDADGGILVRGPTSSTATGSGRRPRPMRSLLARRWAGLVRDRRPRGRRGRVPGHPGSVEGPDHLGRVQRLPGRGRGRPARPSRRSPRSR